MKNKPLILIILDGWGYSENLSHNAIANANIPNWKLWWQSFPHALLECSGKSVGLPPNQIGNSEVGHMHIGGGRIIHQSLTRINKAISEGKLLFHPLLKEIMTAKKPVHLIGLVSPGGVHSHESHFWSIINLAKKNNTTIYIHAFLDGRDTPPKSAESSLIALTKLFEGFDSGNIVSICGRYYAMDRDNRYDRTKKAYDLLTQKADYIFPDPITALNAAYARGETDEFVKPTYCTENPILIKDDDIVIFMNFRSDRARQLTHALTEKQFNAFERKNLPALSQFITLTEYDKNFTHPILFPKENISHTLGEILAYQNLKQLRIAETEKYAHVTYFFNCGKEDPWPNEERILIPSPKVKTYNLKPQMSAYEITDKLIENLSKYDFIVCNFANPDMVGHTGDFAATCLAIETIDQCLNKIYLHVKNLGGEIIITSDHGNAEMMFDPKTNQQHTAHTKNLVPFLYLGNSAKLAHSRGSLIDVAPTILHLFTLNKPKEMSGVSLLNKNI